jgi:hypothetical protein
MLISKKNRREVYKYLFKGKNKKKLARENHQLANPNFILQLANFNQIPASDLFPFSNLTLPCRGCLVRREGL